MDQLLGLGFGVAIQLKDQFTANAAKAEGAMGQLADKSDAMVARINAGMAKIKAGAAIAGVGLAISAAFLPAIISAAEFNKAMTEVSTLVDPTVVDMKALESQVLSLSETYGQAPVDTARALYNTISGGYTDVAEAAQLLETANKLAVAGATDVNTAFEGLLAAMKPYETAVKDAGRVSDVLFQTVNAGITTIPELADKLGQVAPIAAATGVTLEELTSGIAAVTASTKLNTAEVATQMKAMFSAVSVGAERTKQVNEKFGTSLDFSREALENKGLLQFLTDMRGEIDKLPLNEQGAALTQLMGSVEAVNAFLVLSSGSGLATFKSSLEGMTTAAGATDAAYRKMAATISFQTAQLGAALKVFLIKVGQALDPIVAMLLSIVRSVVGGLNAMMERFPGATKAVILFAFSFGLVVAALGTFMALQGAVSIALPALAAAFAAFGITVQAALWPITLLVLKVVVVVGLIIGAVMLLKKAWDSNFLGIRETLTGFMDAVELVVQAVVAVFQTLNGSTGMISKDLADKLEEKGLMGVFLRLVQVAYRVRQFFAGLFEGFKVGMAQVLEPFREAWASLQEALADLWEATQPVREAWAAVLEQFMGTGEGAKGLGQIVGGLLAKAIGNALTPLLWLIKILGWLVQGLAFVYRVLSPLIAALIYLGGFVVKAVVVSIQSLAAMVALVVESIIRWWNAAWDLGGQLVDTAKAWVGAIVGGLQFLAGMALAAFDFLTGGMFGLSDTAGGLMDAGWAKIQGFFLAVADLFKSWVDVVLAPFGLAWEDLRDVVLAAISPILEAVQALLGYLSTAMETAMKVWDFGKKALGLSPETAQLTDRGGVTPEEARRLNAERWAKDGAVGEAAQTVAAPLVPPAETTAAQVIQVPPADPTMVDVIQPEPARIVDAATAPAPAPDISLATAAQEANTDRIAQAARLGAREASQGQENRPVVVQSHAVLQLDGRVIAETYNEHTTQEMTRRTG